MDEGLLLLLNESGAHQPARLQRRLVSRWCWFVSACVNGNDGGGWRTVNDDGSRRTTTAQSEQRTPQTNASQYSQRLTARLLTGTWTRGAGTYRQTCTCIEGGQSRRTVTQWAAWHIDPAPTAQCGLRAGLVQRWINSTKRLGALVKRLLDEIPQFHCPSDVLADRRARWLVLSTGEKRLVGKRDTRASM